MKSISTKLTKASLVLILSLSYPLASSAKNHEYKSSHENRVAVKHHAYRDRSHCDRNIIVNNDNDYYSRSDGDDALDAIAFGLLIGVIAIPVLLVAGLAGALGS